jgi:hypothetical protein
MNEEIAEKVNHMTKIIMAATADAWVIHMPGMVRRHEVFTAEQLAMNRSNVEDLVANMQDSTDDNDASRSTFFLSYCFLNSAAQGLPLGELRNSLSWQETMSEPRNSSLLLLYSKEAKVANSKELDRPVWAQASVGSNACTARRTFTCHEASRAEAEAQGQWAEGSEYCRREATTIPSFFLDRQTTSGAEHPQEAP